MSIVAMGIGSILSGILKAVGILLLGVLGLVTAFLLFLLFLPFHYAAQGAYAGVLTVRGQVSWLFHILSVRAGYDGAREQDTLHWQLRVFGVPVADNLRRQKKEAAKREKAAKRAEKRAGKGAAENAETAKTVAEANGTGKEPAKEPGGTGEGKSTPQAKKKRPAGKRKSPWEHICYTFRAICDKIKQIFENLSYYWNLLQQEETKQALLLCRDQLLGLFRSIRPRQLKVRLMAGTGDPASTGQLAAGYGIAYPFLADILDFTPDFERKVLEGDFRLKGHITVIRILKAAWILYFDKNIRKLLHYLKKEEMKHV